MSTRTAVTQILRRADEYQREGHEPMAAINVVTDDQGIAEESILYLAAVGALHVHGDLETAAESVAAGS